MSHQFESAHAIGDRVEMFLFADHPSIGMTGVIKAVVFTKRKVSYDVRLDIGGKTLRNVDSTFVTVGAPKVKPFKVGDRVVVHYITGTVAFDLATVTDVHWQNDGRGQREVAAYDVTTAIGGVIQGIDPQYVTKAD